MPNQTDLNVIRVLTGKYLIRRVNKVKRVSRKPWNDVAELEAEHNQPTLHICKTKQGKDSFYKLSQEPMSVIYTYVLSSAHKYKAEHFITLSPVT